MMNRPVHLKKGTNYRKNFILCKFFFFHVLFLVVIHFHLFKRHYKCTAFLPSIRTKIMQEYGNRVSRTTSFVLKQQKNKNLYESEWNDVTNQSFVDHEKIFLVSFPNYKHSLGINHHYTQIIWKWKDNVFGKGGIYFNSKLKSLGAFHTYLKNHQTIQTSNSNNNDELLFYTVKSCVVLSNCARMDILLHFDDNDPLLMDGPTSQQVLSYVSKCIATQITYWKKQPFRRFLSKLSLDIPSIILTTTSMDDKVSPFLFSQSSKDTLEMIEFLESNLVVVKGNEQIARHYCLIASGLASRPRITHENENQHTTVSNNTIFRPFSSWDAHIMKQLKQTMEVCQSSNCMSPVTKLIFDFALQAGKAARNKKIVPILEELQTNPSNEQLMCMAQKDVHKNAIEPTVKLCLSRLQALGASDSISGLYNQASTLLLVKYKIDISSDEGRESRKLLHEPIMKLRQGQKIDIDKVLQEIEMNIVSN